MLRLVEVARKHRIPYTTLRSRAEARGVALVRKGRDDHVRARDVKRLIARGKRGRPRARA